MPSIRYLRHAREQQATDVEAGRQVAQACKRGGERFQPFERDLAVGREELAVAIEIIRLFDLVRA